MNYKKLILVGFISAFVAFLTSIMGVAGTIIGSVISSVLYNMLTEVLEKPMAQAKFSTNFEWEIAYIFPLVVIVIIQLLLIFALLSEMGILPYSFLNVYLSLQQVANNNLYRVLGFALIIISVYPLVLKPDIIKKSHGIIIAFVGLIFLARGFVDLGNRITDIYDAIFAYFDLPIAVIALILLIFVIFKIVVSARESENEFNIIKHKITEDSFKKDNDKLTNSVKHKREFPEKRQNIGVNPNNSRNSPKSEVKFKNHIVHEKHESGINKSSNNIHFESNDLLDDYKK